MNPSFPSNMFLRSPTYIHLSLFKGMWNMSTSFFWQVVCLESNTPIITSHIEKEWQWSLRNNEELHKSLLKCFEKHSSCLANPNHLECECCYKSAKNTRPLTCVWRTWVRHDCETDQGGGLVGTGSFLEHLLWLYSLWLWMCPTFKLQSGFYFTI